MIWIEYYFIQDIINILLYFLIISKNTSFHNYSYIHFFLKDFELRSVDQLLIVSINRSQLPMCIQQKSIENHSSIFKLILKRNYIDLYSIMNDLNVLILQSYFSLMIQSLLDFIYNTQSFFLQALI